MQVFANRFSFQIGVHDCVEIFFSVDFRNPPLPEAWNPSYTIRGIGGQMDRGPLSLSVR
jgi:hypothetical protein